jgi:hypothetical protein
MTGQTETGAQLNADERTDLTEAGSTPEQENGSESPGTDNRQAGLAEARDRYRSERDQAREAVTAAAARIEALQLRELHRLAGEHLAEPGDLLTLGGGSLADYLDENGDVDPERVSEAVADVLAARPGLRPNARPVDLSHGIGNDRPGKRELSFNDLFRS